MTSSIRTCLWFRDGRGREAAEFCCSLIPGSRVETTFSGDNGHATFSVIDFSLGGVPPDSRRTAVGHWAGVDRPCRIELSRFAAALVLEDLPVTGVLANGSIRCESRLGVKNSRLGSTEQGLDG